MPHPATNNRTKYRIAPALAHRGLFTVWVWEGAYSRHRALTVAPTIDAAMNWLHALDPRTIPTRNLPDSRPMQLDGFTTLPTSADEYPEWYREYRWGE